jgi:HD domain
VPTELILVPMLFVLPVGLVPLAVAAGVVVGSLDEHVRGSLSLPRVGMRVVFAWYAVGPALVLGLAGERGPQLSDWPLYVVALLSQFVLDTLCAAGREWLALGVRPSVQLRAMVWVYAIDAGLAPVGLAVAFATESSPYGVVLALPLVALLSVFARERRVRIDHELELRDAYRGTAFLLGDVVEADDEYTGAHSRDVVELTLKVVDELGLSARERRDAEFAALLHDVGKVRVPNSIINKPGPLTAERALSWSATRSKANGCSCASAACSARSGGSSVPATSAGTARGIRTGSPASASRCSRGSSRAATPTTP